MHRMTRKVKSQLERFASVLSEQGGAPTSVTTMKDMDDMLCVEFDAEADNKVATLAKWLMSLEILTKRNQILGKWHSQDTTSSLHIRCIENGVVITLTASFDDEKEARQVELIHQEIGKEKPLSLVAQLAKMERNQRR